MSQVARVYPGEKDQPKKLVYVWQRPVRIFHWATALCITVLFLTGWYIAFPVLTTPGEAWDQFLMARVRQIHFFAAYLWLVAYLLRCAWFFLGNKYARSGMPRPWSPAWWREFFVELFSYAFVRRERSTRLGHNALAGVSYTIFPIGLGLAQILTGFALYSETDPSGLAGRLTGWMIPLLGGSFRAHMWHHLFAWGFLWFVIVHVYIVVFDSIRDRNSLVESMITGYKSQEVDAIAVGKRDQESAG